jgi:hypothetical protein
MEVANLIVPLASVRLGSRQQAQKQKQICRDFVRALLESEIWLQAGEDRAIAAGSQADLKRAVLA